VSSLERSQIFCIYSRCYAQAANYDTLRARVLTVQSTHLHDALDGRIWPQVNRKRTSAATTLNIVNWIVILRACPRCWRGMD